MDALTIAKLIENDYNAPPQYTEWGVECSLNVSTDGAVVIFRGTDEPSDWFKNIWARPHKTPVGWCHKGFWEGVEAIWPVIFADVFAVSRNYDLTIAGHSKGGAEASIFAALAEQRNMPIERVITFGAARPGRLKTLNAPIDRYVFGADPVPHMPPWLRHPAKPIKCARRIGFNVPDHHISNYIKWLENV